MPDVKVIIRLRMPDKVFAVWSAGPDGRYRDRSPFGAALSGAGWRDRPVHDDDPSAVHSPQAPITALRRLIAFPEGW